MTIVARLRFGVLGTILVVAGCAGGGSGPDGPPATGSGSIAMHAGDGQMAVAGTTLQPYAVLVTDSAGRARAGVSISWQVVSGCGSVSPATSASDANGIAQTVPTLGLPLGLQQVRAQATGYANSPVIFGSQATAPAGTVFTVRAGCNNVPERYSSDLWLAWGHAYTGTWNWVQRTTGVAGAIKVFVLSPTGAPVLSDSVLLRNVTTVSDLQVSPDSQWLVATAEGGSAEGVYVYSLANPGHPIERAKQGVSAGLHTGTLGEIGGKLYAFTAKNPANPALIIFDLSDVATGNISIASSTPVPANYGIHDTVVRDGICFAFVWNTGVYVYDVGNGIKGGTPQVPVLVGSIPINGGEAHNGWWFWNPTNGEKKYLFVGQEGPGTIGSTSSGAIHVVDVSNLAAPVEVASYSMAGAGTHNFWVDEPEQRLYAAYYNGGVVALDISGTLSGDLAQREIARIRPGGPGKTYVWGVMQYKGSLYALDMLSGLWQLGQP